MKLEFDLNQVSTTEFGVGRDDNDDQIFSIVPVDGTVQAALGDAARNTWNAMQELSKDPAKYEPSEKYASHEYVYVPVGDALAQEIQNLHTASNLATDTKVLDNAEDVFCYFARIVDKQGRHLTGLQRATRFKGLLKSRLIRFVSDALKLIEDRVFRIDNDFDLIVDAKNVHVLRPSGFEFAGKLKDAVLAAVPQNVKLVQQDLKFVDFDNIQAYAAKHSRAARYLASIRSQKETKGIDRNALKNWCKKTGVDVDEVDGKLTVPDEQIMGFLEVLDRRRYEIELVKASPERFRAASRRKIEA